MPTSVSPSSCACAMRRIGRNGAANSPASIVIYPSSSAFEGALYGTTTEGGLHGMGTVFKLTPPAAGKRKWKRTVLHHFRGGRDGAVPLAGLVRAPTGALYGTTDTGGAGACSGGCGTVYELKPGPGDTWTYAVIHRFRNVRAGVRTSAQLSIKKGVLYGTTSAGGAHDRGTIFSLRWNGTKWRHWVLHSFAGGEGDGQYPRAGVVFGPDGALYGTTETGGKDVGANGTVFRLAQTEGGGPASWEVSLLHRFQGGDDGEGPLGPVAFDASGALYGTTPYGGGGPCFLGCGTVFRLAKQTGDQWDKQTIHRFAPGTDGSFPRGSLVATGAGVLYGTTTKGGNPSSLGTVFRLRPPKPGSEQWKATVLHKFAGPDGSVPFGGVILRSGVLYGTTRDGGASGGAQLGTVFALTP